MTMPDILLTEKFLINYNNMLDFLIMRYTIIAYATIAHSISGYYSLYKAVYSAYKT